MLTVYLNSLHNMLIRKNPFKLYFQKQLKNVQAFFNLRKNMSCAHRKMMVMEQRQQQVNELIEGNSTAKKLDLKR